MLMSIFVSYRVHTDGGSRFLTIVLKDTDRSGTIGFNGIFSGISLWRSIN